MKIENQTKEIRYEQELESLVKDVIGKAEVLFNYQSVRTAAEFYVSIQKLFVPFGYSGKGFFRGGIDFDFSLPGDLESHLMKLTLNPFHESSASYTRMDLNQDNPEESLEINKAIVYIEPLEKGLPLLAKIAFNKTPILVPKEVNINGDSKKFDFTSSSNINIRFKQS